MPATPSCGGSGGARAVRGRKPPHDSARRILRRHGRLGLHDLRQLRRTARRRRREAPVVLRPSARVAAHWAEHWYAARGEAIRAILAPAGFDATRGEQLDEPRFVPAGEYGYIEREAGELTADWSVLESHDDPDAVLKMLEQRYAGLLDDGRCHCEMCESRPAGA